ncbi:MAG: murein biosynthesis integral membrane protein MurJ [Phycisphaerales bacterium]|nr:MAG: murein biosynthesis integral membrane protein MurJ [Phycisphaerales bacterium]
MIRGFRQIAFLTTLSRVLGMVRDMTFAHFFGAGWLMTAWTMGFKIPNLARRLFGEGAASASLIPVYSEQLHSRPERAAILANTTITVVFTILAAIVLFGEGLIWAYYYFFETRVGPRLGLALCSVMLPYMMFVCTVAILAGILNVHKRFATPAAAPILLNVFVIGSLVFAGWVLKMEARQQVFLVAVAVLVAGLAQIAIQIPSLRASGVSIKPAWDIHSEAFRKVVVLMGPMILGLTVTQLNTLADDIIALSFMNEQGEPLGYGAPSYLYYAQRLYQFPLGVLGISLATAIFPVMSADSARRDYGALTKTIARGIRAGVFVALPATAGIFLVAKPLVSAIFEHGEFRIEDTPVVAWTLSFYAAGLCGYFAQQVTTRAFYSMQNSRTPARSAVIAVFANVVLNLILIWFLGTGGLAAATAVCSYLQVVILVGALRRRLGGAVLDGVARTLGKTFVATVLMSLVGAAILLSMHGLPEARWSNVLRLAAVVPSAAAVYLLAARLLRLEMLSLLTGRRDDGHSV